MRILLFNILSAVIVTAFADVAKGNKNRQSFIKEASVILRQRFSEFLKHLGYNSDYITDKEFDVAIDEQMVREKMGRTPAFVFEPSSSCQLQLRLPGGLHVDGMELLSIVQEEDFSKSVAHMSRNKKASSQIEKLRQNLKTYSTEVNKSTRDGEEYDQHFIDGVPISHADADQLVHKSIKKLIRRYGEWVPHGKDDDNIIRLLKVESIKANIASVSHEADMAFLVNELLQVRFDQLAVQMYITLDIKCTVFSSTRSIPTSGRVWHSSMSMVPKKSAHPKDIASHVLSPDKQHALPTPYTLNTKP
jgi:hypothetical protein